MVIGGSVVIPRLQKVHEAAVDAVYQPILLCNSTRPDVCAYMSQGLRFSDTSKRIAQCGVHQVQSFECDPAVGIHPVPQVLEALWLHDRLSRRDGRLRPRPLVRATFAPRHEISSARFVYAQRGSEALERDGLFLSIA